MEPAPSAPPAPPKTNERAAAPKLAVALSADQLLAARQRQTKSQTIVTLQSGERFKLELQEDGTELLIPDALLGRSDGFVADTKPDDAVCHVIPGLFIGSQDASRNLPALLSNNVTHILNAAAAIVQNAHPTQFKYLSLDVLDLPDFDMRPYFESSWQFIHEAIASGGGVLVHCNAGISRSATLVMSYLIKFHHLSYEEAYNVTKAARPAILPNGGFQKILRDLAAVELTPVRL